MKEQVENVYSYIKENNLIKENDNLVLAVSGGADSISMLYILNELNIKHDLNLNMVICHLNHMIREEAESDLEYVKERSEYLNLQFFAKAVNIKEISMNQKKSEEEVGREERYKFFNEIGEQVFGKDQYKICTAHNLNDNTETVFLNLLRGTGVDGLKGIENKNQNIVRPILILSRKEIEKYLNENNIRYVIDKTNLESEYTRNSIRNELLPFIKEKYNANIDQTIYRMSEILTDEDILLNNIIEKELKDIMISSNIKNKYKDSDKDNNKNENENKNEKENIDEIKLDLKKFNELNIALRRRLLRHILKEYLNTYKDISKVNIDDAIEIAFNNIGNKYIMLNKYIKFSVLRGEVIINKIKE